MSARPPPNVRVTLAHGLGVAVSLHSPTPLLLPSLLLTAAALLIWTWPRPHPNDLPTKGLRRESLALALSLALSLGLFTGQAALERSRSDCRRGLADGESLSVVGWFTARPGRGSAPFHVGTPDCRATLRAFTVRGVLPPATGEVVQAHGTWARSRYPSLNPARSGTLRISKWRSLDNPGEPPVGASVLGGDLRSGPTSRVRARIESSIESLFGEQSSMVDAVLLAGRSGLDPDLRDRFAASGTVHLLAISGFHVGVVSGILILLVGRLGLPPRVSILVSTLGVVLYVAFLGFPAAATRAAMLLCGLMAARLRGSPVSSVGLLASVFTMLLLFDPLWIIDVGFQLSFAGALGLVLWSEPLRDRCRRLRWRRRRLPRGLADAIAAGVAATLPTIPLVAFHFGRVSVVGIPATVLVTPLFVLAIPWTLVALALDVVSHGGALFVAGAAGSLYAVAAGIVSWIGVLPGVAPVVSNATVMALTLIPVMGVLALRRVGRVRSTVRWGVWALVAVAGVLVAPVASDVSGLGRLEIVMLDVGQGDAIVIRTPDARWIVVDAGPVTLHRDAGAEVVVPFLRRRGVRRLERVYFTHPDLDHIGGGPALLAALEVAVVADPGLAEGKRSYLDLLEAARVGGIPWQKASPGTVWSIDGITLRVLAPLPLEVTGGTGGNDTDANAASVVLALQYGDFSMLLTGDAPDDVEAALLRSGVLNDVDVLKVGHHGSSTSTSRGFLDAVRPELAIISVGRSNRYGHPDRFVLDRLRSSGARIERTDLVGHIRVLARDDGSWTVETGRIR